MGDPMSQPRTHTYVYGNVEIVVHRPSLDEKENHRREVALRRAVAAFGKEMHKREVTKNGTMAPVHG